MIKAIFFDIDGTLVSVKTHKILPQDREALANLQRRGIKVILSTGRHIDFTNNAPFPVDGIIGTNGAMGHLTADGKPHLVREERNLFKQLYSHPMPRELAREIVAKINEHHLTTVVFTEKGPFVNKYSECYLEGEKILKFPRLDIADLEKAAETEGFLSLCVFATLDEEAEYFSSLRDKVTITRWCPQFMDINQKGATKGASLEEVAGHLGISIAETAAFGDGGNDISMIMAAGTGVAMGNASPEVRAAADFVTASVEEGGVSLALEKLGLLG